MCVIMIAESEEGRPNGDQIKAMFEANSEGAGVAWQAEGRVHWEKGLKLERAIELALTVPAPFVAHFRISTCGGSGPLVTHPFIVDKQSPLVIKGSAKAHLLFHNGHWGQWKDKIFDTAVKHKIPLPTGTWTDSRAMAWMAAVYGLGILEFIDEKAAVIGPTGEVETFGSGWKYMPDGFWVSNTGWEYRAKKAQGSTPKSDTGWCKTGQAQGDDPVDSEDHTRRTPSAIKSSTSGASFYHAEVPASLGPHVRKACPSTPVKGGDPLEAVPFGQVEMWWSRKMIPPGEEKLISKKRFKRLRKCFDKKVRAQTLKALKETNDARKALSRPVEGLILH